MSSFVHSFNMPWAPPMWGDIVVLVTSQYWPFWGIHSIFPGLFQFPFVGIHAGKWLEDIFIPASAAEGHCGTLDQEYAKNAISQRSQILRSYMLEQCWIPCGDGENSPLQFCATLTSGFKARLLLCEKFSVALGAQNQFQGLSDMFSSSSASSPLIPTPTLIAKLKHSGITMEAKMSWVLVIVFTLRLQLKWPVGLIM